MQRVRVVPRGPLVVPGVFDCLSSPYGIDVCCLTTFIPCITCGNIVKEDLKPSKNATAFGVAGGLSFCGLWYLPGYVHALSSWSGVGTLLSGIGIAYFTNSVMTKATFTHETGCSAVITNKGDPSSCEGMTGNLLCSIFCPLCTLCQVRNTQFVIQDTAGSNDTGQPLVAPSKQVFLRM